jgi:hypothetical protein
MRPASFMSPSRRRWYFGAVIVLPLLGLLSCSMSAEDGYTPLFIAAQNGDAEETRVLLDGGADANKASTDTGCTPLFGTIAPLLVGDRGVGAARHG